MILVAVDDAVATRVLDDRECRQVDTLSAVRERAGEADVIVAGDLPDADAERVVAAARRAAPETPVVALDPDVDADATADPADLEETVDAVERVQEYCEAVDELYERAQAAAEGEDADVDRARRRADASYERARAATGETPYDALLDE